MYRETMKKNTGFKHNTKKSDVNRQVCNIPLLLCKHQQIMTNVTIYVEHILHTFQALLHYTTGYILDFWSELLFVGHILHICWYVTMTCTKCWPTFWGTIFSSKTDKHNYFKTSNLRQNKQTSPRQTYKNATHWPDSYYSLRIKKQYTGNTDTNLWLNAPDKKIMHSTTTSHISTE